MKIVSFSPFEPIDYVRDRLDRMVANIEESSHSYSYWKPAVELFDAGDNLILRMSLAGVSREDLDIEVTRDSVKIAGERHRFIGDSANLYSEFNYGQFQRHVSLPIEVVNTQAQASYSEGILTLTLPKVEEAKNRIVKVSLENANDSHILSEAKNTAELEAAAV